MDRIASEGANCIYHAQAIGLTLPSENARFVLLGYDMKKFDTVFKAELTFVH
jgi:2,3-bisphosphoglycerate-independent phosphoglycerate mutase